MRLWRWYITIAATRQWMILTGRKDTNPAFIAAQNELGELSLTAKPARLQSGMWRIT